MMPLRLPALALLVAALGACDDTTPRASAPMVDGGDPADGAVSMADGARDPDGRLPDEGDGGAVTPVADAERGPPDTSASPDAASVTRALTPEGVLAPMGRVVEMAIPEDPPAARRAGCVVHGRQVGTGPYNLNLVAGGDVFGQLTPQGDGHIPVVMLLRAAGWPAGLAGEALETVDIEFFGGRHTEDRAFVVSADQFVDGDPQNPALIHFDEVPLRGGWFVTEPNAFNLPLVVLDGPVIPVPLMGTQLRGRLAADGPGLRIDHGILTGYVTYDSLAQLITHVRILCERGEAIGVCALLGDQLGRPDEELVALIVSILGNYDARVEGDYGFPCEPEGEGVCDAVGLCVTYAARGVSLARVE